MCNLYSITTNQAAIIAFFRVMNRYVPAADARRTLADYCRYARCRRNLFYDGNVHAKDFESLLFLDNAFSLRILRAYTAIKDQAVQRQFVTLVEMIADSQGHRAAKSRRRVEKIGDGLLTLGMVRSPCSNVA